MTGSPGMPRIRAISRVTETAPSIAGMVNPGSTREPSPTRAVIGMLTGMSALRSIGSAVMSMAISTLN